MGLSIAISGAIILSVLMIVLMTITGFVGNMFTIGDTSIQVSKLENIIDKTDISLDALEASVSSPYVNFTLNNDDIEKLWNFEHFDVFIEYENATNTFVEELSFNGDCSGIAPSAGNWCIESIGADFLDEGIINDGESGEIWTQVSRELDSANPFVTVSTDNGVVAKLPDTKNSWIDAAPAPSITCEVGNYGRTFVDTDTGVSYICDPTRDKWLSFETITLLGEEGGNCGDGAAPVTGGCDIEWGNALGGAGQTIGIYMPFNFTIVGYSFSSLAQGACSGVPGTFAVEIWGAGVGGTADSPQSFIADVAPGLIDDESGSGSINVDVQGDRFINYGLDNDCGVGIDDFVILLNLKWHHDDP